MRWEDCWTSYAIWSPIKAAQENLPLHPSDAHSALPPAGLTPPPCSDAGRVKAFLAFWGHLCCVSRVPTMSITMVIAISLCSIWKQVEWIGSTMLCVKEQSLFGREIYGCERQHRGSFAHPKETGEQSEFNKYLSPSQTPSWILLKLELTSISCRGRGSKCFRTLGPGTCYNNNSALSCSRKGGRDGLLNKDLASGGGRARHSRVWLN